MATITTKYSVGDTVWYATTLTTQKALPCPDCNDLREWTVRSPAGKQYTFACPRCSAGYFNNRDLGLTYAEHEPSVMKLTIGQVRYNDWQDGASYMCAETGVGSGQIYREANLFDTEEAAMMTAKQLAWNRNQEAGPAKYSKELALKLHDYQLSDALVKSAESRERETRYELEDFVTKIADAVEFDGIEGVKRALKAYRGEEDDIA